MLGSLEAILSGIYGKKAQKKSSPAQCLQKSFIPFLYRMPKDLDSVRSNSCGLAFGPRFISQRILLLELSQLLELGEKAESLLTDSVSKSDWPQITFSL